MIFGKLLENVYAAVGLLELRNLATGGSATTIQDTSLVNKKGTNYYKDHIFFISKTTDGASPQGKFGIITSYATGATPTFTIPTVTDAVGAGDVYAVAKDTITLYEMIGQINMAMGELPAIRHENTSLTAAQDTLEYTLPIATKGYKIQEVMIGNATDGWKPVKEWKVKNAVGGSTETLVFQYQPPYDSATAANKTIRLIYLGKPAELATYSDTINEAYPDELVVSLCAWQVLQYYINKKNLHNNKGWMGRFQMAQQRYQKAAMDNPVRVQAGVQPRTFMWSSLP